MTFDPTSCPGLADDVYDFFVVVLGRKVSKIVLQENQARYILKRLRFPDSREGLPCGRSSAIDAMTASSYPTSRRMSPAVFRVERLQLRAPSQIALPVHRVRGARIDHRRIC